MLAQCALNFFQLTVKKNRHPMPTFPPSLPTMDNFPFLTLMVLTTDDNDRIIPFSYHILMTNFTRYIPLVNKVQTLQEISHPPILTFAKKCASSTEDLKKRVKIGVNWGKFGEFGQKNGLKCINFRWTSSPRWTFSHQGGGANFWILFTSVTYQNRASKLGNHGNTGKAK